MDEQEATSVPLASMANESRSQSPPPVRSHGRAKKILIACIGVVVVAAVLVAVLVTAPWDNGSSGSGGGG